MYIKELKKTELRENWNTMNVLLEAKEEGEKSWVGRQKISG